MLVLAAKKKKDAARLRRSIALFEFGSVKLDLKMCKNMESIVRSFKKCKPIMS